MKKLASLILCVLMLVSAAACGADAVSTTATTATTVTTEITKPTTGTTATTQGTKPTTGTTATTQGTTSTSVVVTPTNVFDEKNIVLSFGAISDVHITGNKTESDKFLKAISDLKLQASKHDGDGLDAIAIAGDIADSGKKTQVELFAQLLKQAKFSNVMLSTGNHDSSMTAQVYKDTLGEDFFRNDVDKDAISHGSRHCVVNGYHFIFVDPKSYGSYCPYREETIEWLDKTLSDITKEDPDAYVFLFTHPMLYDTCYGSTLGAFWNTKYLTETVSKYPQVMTFGGHLHFPVNDERSIMQTAFTSLGCGSVRYLAIEGGYANASGTVPDNAYTVSSGLLVQVDANGNVRITRMDFTKGTTFKEPWELEHPAEDGAHLERYTKDRKNGNKAPILSGKVTCTTSSVADMIQARISLPAGTDDDMIHHYVIKIIDRSTGKAVKTLKVLSDFYLKSQVSDMSDTFSYDIGELPVGDYKIEVTAVDSWDAVSNKLVCEISAGTPEDITAELPDTYADIDFENGVAVDKNGKLSVKMSGATIINTPLTFAGNAKNVNALTVKAAKQCAIVTFNEYDASNMADFYNNPKGFSVEGLFINRKPNGSQGIICGTQSGGWGIAQSAGAPYLFTYIGDSSLKLTASAATSDTELTHVVATFIYDSALNKTFTTLYINGEVSVTGSKTGRIAVSASAAAANAFSLGSDIDIKGGGSEYCQTDFSLVDMKMYASVLNYKQVETAYNNAAEAFKN